VGVQPTVDEMSFAAVAASKAPAATRAGMARKNEIRVAATRSRPRNSPALMVAPERETPGTRAMHWTRPITMASVRFISFSGRRLLPTISATTITTLQTSRPATTTHRLRRLSVMMCRPRKPMTPIGMVPMITYQAMR
jgi:hypothetical protein